MDDYGYEHISSVECDVFVGGSFYLLRFFSYIFPLPLESVSAGIASFIVYGRVACRVQAHKVGGRGGGESFEMHESIIAAYLRMAIPELFRSYISSILAFLRVW